VAKLPNRSAAEARVAVGNATAASGGGGV